MTARAFEALLAGFVVTLGLSFAATLLIRRLVPDWSGETGNLSRGYVVVHLGISFLAAAAGGFATAAIAGSSVFADVLGLSLTLLVVAALSALQGRGKLPVAYLLASVAMAPLGAMAGGLVLLRVQGVL